MLKFIGHDAYENWSPQTESVTFTIDIKCQLSGRCTACMHHSMRLRNRLNLQVVFFSVASKLRAPLEKFHFIKTINSIILYTHIYPFSMMHILVFQMFGTPYNLNSLCLHCTALSQYFLNRQWFFLSMYTAKRSSLCACLHVCLYVLDCLKIYIYV